MTEFEHKLDCRLTLGIVFFIALFLGGMFWRLNKAIESVKVDKENIGTFLITRFNENEKSCPRDIMANGKKVYVGAVAISPDVRDSGLLMFGDKIEIDGYGIYEVSCLTAKRHKRVIDIYTPSLNEAKTHGAKRKRVWLIKK